MTLSSHINLHIPSFATNDIRVRFHESPQHGDAYIVDLGDTAYLRMRPADLRDLITKATAAMNAHGDLAEPDDTAVREAADAAEERQWDALGRTVKAAS